MIKLNKPTTGPRIPYTDPKLKGKCVLEERTKRLKDYYANDPKTYDAGGKFSFDSSLWGDKLIKDALKIKVQKNRCCYCEKDITDGGSVDHFRPKDGVRQKQGDPIEKPGYYWLAYEWKNWLYACLECNRAKGTYFPLEDPVKRAKNHLVDENCINENPLLIDPSLVDPKEFVKFVGLEILPDQKNKTRGNLIIETLQLDREELFYAKVDHMQLYWARRDAMQINGMLQKDINDYNNWLEDSSLPGRKFSFMMNCNLEAWKIASLPKLYQIIEAFLLWLNLSIKRILKIR